MARHAGNDEGVVSTPKAPEGKASQEFPSLTPSPVLGTFILFMGIAYAFGDLGLDELSKWHGRQTDEKKYIVFLFIWKV